MAKNKKTAQVKERPSNSFISSMSPTTQDLLCVLFLYLVTLFLFRAIVFNDAAFSAEGDTANALIVAKVGDTLKEREGLDPIWMQYFFSGMPTFGNVSYLPHDVNYIQWAALKILNLLYLNTQWGWLVVYYLLSGVFMFLLLRVWKLTRLPALVGALIFMLSPYAIGLAAEGHGSKLMALSYLPLVFLLTHVMFERRNLLNFGLTSAAIGTLLLTNHMQIVYYVFIVIGLYLVYHIISDLRTSKLNAVKKTGLFVGALFLGLCISAYVYFSVYEYAQFSIRGGGSKGATGGLTWDYATNWSWHPQEVLTLVIPSFFGFQTPYYWGTMPFTNSTVYVGIVAILFSIIAVIYWRSKTTLFVTILTVIIFFVSFGKHFSPVYEVLFTYLPFFNKFRAPVMIMHLLPFATGILAAYGLTFIIESRGRLKDFNPTKFTRALTYVLGILIAVLIAGEMFKPPLFESLSGFMFVREGEQVQIRQQYGQNAQQAMAFFTKTRFDLLWKDYIKFVMIAGASIGAVILFLRRKIQTVMFNVMVIGILLIDLVIIDTKFISPKPANEFEKNIQPNATVNFLRSQENGFRVFPIGELFMDNTYAYYGIESIGGYSPAKLKIYQTLLDSCLYKGPNPEFPLNMSIINMLNVKYIIARGQLPPGFGQLVHADQARTTLVYSNPTALPRAFFVDDIRVAANEREIFRGLNNADFDPSSVAILEAPLTTPVSRPDSTFAQIQEYQSRKIRLNAYTSSPALLVLSEVYYPAGWKAYIDGKETEIHKTNYILRSIVVPAGAHEIIFEFDPTSYKLGWAVTHAGWGVVGLCILIGLWQIPFVKSRLRRKNREEMSG